MQTQQHTTTLKRDSQIASVFSVFMQLCFQEEPSNGWFPELQDLPSSVTFMDMKLVGFQRITSLGCQTGYLQCALVDLASNSKSYVLRLFLCQICTRPPTQSCNGPSFNVEALGSWLEYDHLYNYAAFSRYPTRSSKNRCCIIPRKCIEHFRAEDGVLYYSACGRVCKRDKCLC